MCAYEELVRRLPGGAQDAMDWDGAMHGPLGWVLGRMAGTPQDPQAHGEGDVLTHTRMTCAALEALPGWQALPPRQRQMVYLAALLHDAGKPGCTRLEDGRWTSRGHSDAGARLARELLWDEYAMCGTPEAVEFRECVCALVEHHALPLHLSGHAEPEREATRLAALGELAHGFTLEGLALLAEADVRGRECEDAERMLRAVEQFRELAADAGCLTGPRAFESAHSRREYMAGRDVAPGCASGDAGWGPVVLMSGLPGTGKDEFIRRELAQLPIVSLDELRLRMGISPSEYQGPVVNAATELAREHLRARRPFVWNATNLTPWMRARQISLFERYGAAVRVIYLETTLDAQQRRNESREYVVPDGTIADMRRQTTLPTHAEAQDVEWICV